MDPIYDTNSQPGHAEVQMCRCERCCGRAADNSAEAKNEPSGASPDAADKRTNEQKAVTDFEAKSGLTVVSNGKNYDYKLSYNGKDATLFSTDKGDKGFKEAEQKLAELVVTKQALLEKTFQVDFSKAGEDVVRQRTWKPDCTVEYGAMIKARAPKLNELYGIEGALYKMQPYNQPTKEGTRLKFHFLEDKYYKGDSVLAYFVHSDKNNRPAVYFEPGANNNKPITEKDADRIGKHQLYSIEGVTVHELGHFYQKKGGWDDGKQYEARAKELGWMPFLTKNKELDFMLKGKNGEFYFYGRDKCTEDNVWVKADKNGNPLGADGKPAGSFKAAKQYSNSEVRKLAESYPPTHYFNNPKEFHAEVLMLFCLNEKYRGDLLRTNPTVYELVKKADQDESIKTYGKLADGSPKYIRATSGQLVENTDESRRAVQAFETNIRRKGAVSMPQKGAKPDAKSATR